MKRKRQVKMTMIIIVLIMVGILSLFVFYSATRDYLRSICNSELQDYALANAATTKSEMENALQLTQIACESFAMVEDYSSEDALKLLRIISHNAPFARMVLSKTDGEGFTSAGGSVDCTKFVNFQRTLYGESCIEAMDVDADGQYEILVGAPILLDGKVKGMLYGIYETFDMSKIINVTSFDGYGYAVLVDLDGNILVPDTNPYCLNAEEENYWTFFEKVSFGKDSSYENLLADIKERKGGIITYSLASEQRELYYTPLGINDWYLLQMVTGDVISNYTGPMNWRVMLLVLQLVVLSFLIGVIIHKRIDGSRKARDVEAERFRALAENIPGGVAEIEVGERCVIDFANDGFFQIMGYSKREFWGEPIYGRAFWMLINEKPEELILRLHKQIQRGQNVYLEYQIRQKNGTIRWVSMTGKVIHEEQGVAFMQTIVTDITLQKQLSAEIMENAKKDKMTHLYDKVSIAELVTREFLQVQMGGTDALLVLDIDNFKNVNDTYGHQVGDQAIIMIANTIRETFRVSDLKGRIGGDEFMVLMKDVTDLAHAQVRVNLFLKNVSELEIANKKGVLSCSVGGVVISMREAHAYEEVFLQADENLYHVKKNGKGRANILPFKMKNQNLERSEGDGKES